MNRFSLAIAQDIIFLRAVVWQACKYTSNVSLSGKSAENNNRQLAVLVRPALSLQPLLPSHQKLDEELQLQRRSFTLVLRSDRDVYEARTEAAQSIADRR